MSKTAIDAKRSNIFMVEPERLTLVTDKDHPLYDPRVEDEPSESMIANIAMHGVLEPVLVRKNGTAIEVVAGRGRTKAAIETNRRLAAEGKPPILVPVLIRGGSDADMFGVMISENEIRREDTMLVKGEKARKLLNMGHSVQQVAVIFGVTRQAVSSWLAVQELPEQIKDAVATGEISATAAIQLTPFSREEQVERFKDLRRQGEKPTVKTTKSAAASKNNKPAPKMKTLREIKQMLEGEIPGPTNLMGYSTGFRDALRWVLGEEELQ